MNSRLVTSEARLAAVIANSHGVAVKWYDERGRVLLWNRAAEEIFGISAADAIGQTPDKLIHTPEEFAVLLDALATVKRTGRPIGPVESTFTRDATVCICESTIFEIPGDERGGHFVCMSVDITHRKRVEEALTISEARYRTLVETAPEAIVVLDVEAERFVDVNPEAARLFDATPDELRQLGPLEVSPTDQPDGRPSAAAAAAYLREAASGGAPVFEWTHRGLDGREVPCEVRLVRLPDPTRTLVRGTITDISLRRQFEEQLRQSQKMDAIGHLAGGVAHDFNNLLTVITGYAETLASHLPPTHPDMALVKSISDAAERAAWLTARLLAFGRRAVVTPQVTDLNVLIHDVEHILRRLIGEHIELRVDLAGEPLMVRLDPGQWSQVMLNLAINARDAMPGTGGVMSIRVFPVGAGLATAGSAGGILRGVRCQRQRLRDRAGDSLEDLRTLLHHQGCGQGHRAWPRRRARHRHPGRRPHRRRVGVWTWHDDYDLSAHGRAGP